MKVLAAVAFGLTLSFGAMSAQAASLDAMIGKWKWTDFEVEVTKCETNPSGAGICAVVTSGPKNVGMEMILSKLEARGEEFLGRIAHPMTGDAYNTRLQLKDANTWSMDGCTDANVCAQGDFVRVN